MKKLLSLLLLLLAWPAEAEELRFKLLPFPGVGYHFYTYLDQARIGSTVQDFAFHAGYTWDLMNVYQSAAPRQLSGRYLNPFPEVNLGWALALSPSWKLKSEWGWQQVRLEPFGNSLAFSQLYEDSPSLGGIQSLGLGWTLDERKDPNFPTQGDFLEFWGRFSPQAIGNPSDFALYSLQGERFFPLGGGTLMAHAMARWGYGNIPWTHKFDVGSDRYLRGYDSHRFTGDRSLVANLEYRQKLVDFALPIKVGFGGALFLDAGRSWESGNGVRFPADIRSDAGTALLILLQDALVGRFDFGVGGEGAYGILLIGSCF